MNDNLKELDRLLAAYVPTRKDQELAARAVVEREAFLRQFPMARLDELLPETYCIGHGDKDNFCWWIERGTNALSSYFPGSSKNYGMFWEKKSNAYRLMGALQRYRDGHPGVGDEEVLREVIACPLKRMVEARGGDGTYEAVTGVGDGFLLKVLILYHPDVFFQINSPRWIDRIIEAYGLEKPGSCVERNKVLRKFYEDRRKLVTSGELTPQAFAGVVARQLGLTNPRFWHMQIHPGASEPLSRDKVLRLITEYGVIGMGRAWKNDLGQPRMFAEDVRDGDIIGVREDGFVALVRVVGPCRDNEQKDDLCWFDIVRPVELLSDEADRYKAEYESQMKRKAHDNLYLPATLSPVKAQCKNKFLQFWYQGGGGPVGVVPPPPPPDVYGRAEFLSEVFMTEGQYDELTSLLRKKKNVILTGAPGVGKTFAAKRLAWALMGMRDPDRVQFVQFHQSSAYEDFICGYKPVAGGGFELRDGVFYSFCRKAAADPGRDYVFIIDEINRGNLSKIFGELLMLIERDKRGNEDYAVQLACRSEEAFVVPANLYIIGMMNTADRSLALMDYALRRRFSFFSMAPGFDTEGFRKSLDGKEGMRRLVEAVKTLNAAIRGDLSLGKGFVIGHSYFCGDSSPEEIVRYEIGPTLEEYWFDNPGRAEEETRKLLEAIQ